MVNEGIHIDSDSDAVRASGGHREDRIRHGHRPSDLPGQIAERNLRVVEALRRLEERTPSDGVED